MVAVELEAHRERLLEIVTEVRGKEIQAKTGCAAATDDNTVAAEHADVLDGYCHENALALAQYIDDTTEYRPFLVWGGVANRRYNSFDNIADLEHSGRTHFWVELRIGETGISVVMELSSESGQTYNEAYCGSETPKEYRTMYSDPSYIEYCPSIDAIDLIGIDSYQYLQKMRPDIFYDSLPE